AEGDGHHARRRRRPSGARRGAPRRHRNAAHGGQPGTDAVADERRPLLERGRLARRPGRARIDPEQVGARVARGVLAEPGRPALLSLRPHHSGADGRARHRGVVAAEKRVSALRILILAVLVAAVGSYIYWQELPQAQKEAEKEKLAGVSDDAVTGVDLAYPDRSISLAKGGGGLLVA